MYLIIIKIPIPPKRKLKCLSYRRTLQKLRVLALLVDLGAAWT